MSVPWTPLWPRILESKQIEDFLVCCKHAPKQPLKNSTFGLKTPTSLSPPWLPAPPLGQHGPQLWDSARPPLTPPSPLFWVSICPEGLLCGENAYFLHGAVLVTPWGWQGGFFLGPTLTSLLFWGASAHLAGWPPFLSEVSPESLRSTSLPKRP